MKSDYLVFQLYAPLVSWGGQAVGQERPSENHPSRSALLGLLGAALGLERHDTLGQQALWESCHFGFKVYRLGITLRDFHTIQVPAENKKAQHLYTRRDELNADKLGATISHRSYQQEHFSVVAVWLNESVKDNASATLSQLQQALQTPHYHLYLGRKSCPIALPLSPEIMRMDSLKSALDQYALKTDMPTLFSKNNPQSRISYFYEQHAGFTSGMQPSYVVPRYDQPLNRSRWQFSARDEYVLLAGGDD